MIILQPPAQSHNYVLKLGQETAVHQTWGIYRKVTDAQKNTSKRFKEYTYISSQKSLSNHVQGLAVAATARGKQVHQ